MKMEIIVKAPRDINCDIKQWPARFFTSGAESAKLVQIQSRSAADVVVAKIDDNGPLGVQANYYISSPTFGVAIPSISSLSEEYWITEQLMNNGMPAPDAVTVAAVLRYLGDF